MLPDVVPSQVVEVKRVRTPSTDTTQSTTAPRRHGPRPSPPSLHLQPYPRPTPCAPPHLLRAVQSRVIVPLEKGQWVMRDFHCTKVGAVVCHPRREILTCPVAPLLIKVHARDSVNCSKSMRHRRHQQSERDRGDGKVVVRVPRMLMNVRTSAGSSCATQFRINNEQQGPCSLAFQRDGDADSCRMGHPSLRQRHEEDTQKFVRMG